MPGENSDTYTESGGPLVIDAQQVTTQSSTITNKLVVEDDDDIRWGTDEDYVTEYNSSDDEWRLFDNGTNNDLLHADTSEIVVNEDGADLDFRVESSGQTDLLSTDAANDRVGIGTGSPASLLDVTGGDIELDNAQYLIGEGSGGSDTQLIGVTSGDRVLVGDVAGNGFVTDIEADGTTAISVQTSGHVNFDNGNVRVNADSNELELGAGQDAHLTYDGTNLVVNPQDSGSGNLQLAAGNVDLNGGNLQFGASSTIEHDRQDVSSDISTDGSGYYSVDASSARTITISSSDEVDGREINIKRNGANNVDINTNDPGTTSIDGVSSTPQLTLSADNESVTLVYNSSNDDWEIY